jgi:hypothetical protein
MRRLLTVATLVAAVVSVICARSAGAAAGGIVISKVQ